MDAHGNTKTERNERLAAYYSSGFSMRETAAKFRCSLENVCRVLRLYFPDKIRRPYDTRQNSTGLNSSARVAR